MRSYSRSVIGMLKPGSRIALALGEGNFSAWVHSRVLRQAFSDSGGDVVSWGDFEFANGGRGT